MRASECGSNLIGMTNEMRNDRGDTSWETADRLDWHLWVLAILLIFVLGVSLLGFMFSAAFWANTKMPKASRNPAATK